VYNLKIVGAFNATSSRVDCAGQRYLDASGHAVSGWVHNLLINLDSWFRATRSSNVDWLKKTTPFLTFYASRRMVENEPVTCKLQTTQL